ncbi:MAG: hypothetical protein Q9226_002034 [Calogaya cf. arnoldii]
MDCTSNHAAIDLRFMDYPTVELEDNEVKTCTACNKPGKSEDVTKDVNKRYFVELAGGEEENIGRKKVKTEHGSTLGPVQRKDRGTGGFKMKEQGIE